MLTPATSFDFTTATPDPRITFARSGATATRVNSSGYIESVAADTLRYDFDPVTLVCRGALIEQLAVNLSLYSNDVTQTGWTIGGLTTSTPTNSPDGTANAVLLLEDNSNGFHRAFRVPTVASGSSLTESAFFKPSGRDWVWLRVNDNVGIKYAWFNVTTGVVGTVQAGLTATIQRYANGFYRCSIATAASVSGAAVMFGTATADNTVSFTGDPTKGIYFYGLQVEQAFGASSYIPTGATTVTRNADVATITGTNFSNWWNAREGSVLARYRTSTVSGTRPVIQFDDTTADEIICLRGNTTNPELYIKDSTDQATIDAGTIAANTVYRFAAGWKLNDCAASINSGASVLDGAATLPTVTQARLGCDGTNYLNGHIEAIKYYNRRLPSAELQALSSVAGSKGIIHSILGNIL